MNKIFSIIILFLYANINLLSAQSIDLSSVDEFFNITTRLREGKNVSEEQWRNFDSSMVYKVYVNREDKTVINTVKSSIDIAFGKDIMNMKDSILNISQEQMDNNKLLMFKKLVLSNYLDINKNYDAIKEFRETYDFNALIEKSKQRLSTFLNKPIDTTVVFSPVYFFFINADGKTKENVIYIDLNLVYKITEEQRIDFFAHEFFHNYRENFENHDFNYKSDLNSAIDLISNEGIADLIDKTDGYKKYYTDMIGLPDMVELMVKLYNQADKDLERLQNSIIKYSKNEITEDEMVDDIIDIVKINGHPIGFFMANQIVKAGYKDEMINEFYNPYKFYYLYNKAAKKNNVFQFSNEFMAYLRSITKDYYH